MSAAVRMAWMPLAVAALEMSRRVSVAWACGGADGPDGERAAAEGGVVDVEGLAGDVADGGFVGEG